MEYAWKLLIKVGAGNDFFSCEIVGMPRGHDRTKCSDLPFKEHLSHVGWDILRMLTWVILLFPSAVIVLFIMRVLNRLIIMAGGTFMDNPVRPVWWENALIWLFALLFMLLIFQIAKFTNRILWRMIGKPEPGA